MPFPACLSPLSCVCIKLLAIVSDLVVMDAANPGFSLVPRDHVEMLLSLAELGEGVQNGILSVCFVLFSPVPCEFRSIG